MNSFNTYVFDVRLTLDAFPEKICELLAYIRLHEPKCKFKWTYKHEVDTPPITTAEMHRICIAVDSLGRLSENLFRVDGTYVKTALIRQKLDQNDPFTPYKSVRLKLHVYNDTDAVTLKLMFIELLTQEQ